ncbi:hypothetical protein V6N13_048258 [Hibiscus sabdariffa]
MEEVKNGNVSPSSSPPTPPTPLPISIGPGNQKYLFTSSPTPSPPFSPPLSRYGSAESLPFLRHHPTLSRTRITSAFSLDRRDQDELHHKSSSCLQDLTLVFMNNNMKNSNPLVNPSLENTQAIDGDMIGIQGGRPLDNTTALDIPTTLECPGLSVFVDV